MQQHLLEVLDKEKYMNLSKSGWISNEFIVIEITFH